MRTLLRPLAATLATLVVLLIGSVDLIAVGTVALSGSPTYPGASMKKYVYTWTANSSGAVSGDTTTIVAPGAFLAQVALVPASGGTQPSDLYDVTLLNTRGVDVLAGLGANVSNAATAELTGSDVFVDAGALQLVVANAGNAKGGTLILWYRIR